MRACIHTHTHQLWLEQHKGSHTGHHGCGWCGCGWDSWVWANGDEDCSETQGEEPWESEARLTAESAVSWRNSLHALSPETVQQAWSFPRCDRISFPLQETKQNNSSKNSAKVLWGPDCRVVWGRRSHVSLLFFLPHFTLEGSSALSTPPPPSQALLSQDLSVKDLTRPGQGRSPGLWTSTNVFVS
jgi:hypothetical protein